MVIGISGNITLMEKEEIAGKAAEKVANLKKKMAIEKDLVFNITNIRLQRVYSWYSYVATTQQQQQLLLSGAVKKRSTCQISGTIPATTLERRRRR